MAATGAFAGTPQGAPEFPRVPEGVTPVKVESRSGADHDTWDLGPAPGEPGHRLYAVKIRAPKTPPVVSVPAALGDSPIIWSLPDGRTVEWSFSLAPTPVREWSESAAIADPAGADGFAAADPGAGALFSRANGGFALRLRAPASGLRTTLTVSRGLRIEAENPGHDGEAASGRLFIVDEENDGRVLTVSLPGVPRAVDDGGGRWRYDLAPSSAFTTAGGGDPVITAWTTPFATWGGAMSTGSGFINGTGTFLYVDVGQLSGAHWAGYLQWDVSSIPTSATVTGVWLYPIYANYFAGAAQTVTVTDVDNGRALTSTFTGYDANYYNDFNGMRAAHPAYGSFTVSAVGNYYPQLNSQAIMDLNNRVRSPNQFVVGLSGASATNGDFLRFTPGSSELFVYYTDHVDSRVMINSVAVRTPSFRYVIDLYNHGDDVAIGGWKLDALNSAGFGGPTVLPAFTLKRHAHVQIITFVSGTNDATHIYAGNYNWRDPGVRWWLRRADDSIVDSLCQGSPPGGSVWTGACMPAAPVDNYDLRRVRDADTDSAADWAVSAAASNDVANPPVLLGSQSGARRRSDVFINHILVWGGYNWISVANYGPTVDLNGWTLALYNNKGSYGTLMGTFTFPAGSTLNTGEVVWLAEGNATFPAYAPIDRLHINTNLAMDWEVAPQGGEAVLKDRDGHGRDYIVFGDVHHQDSGHLPTDLSWRGPFIAISGANPDIIRDSDLNLPTGTTWIQQAGVTRWGLLGPSCRGPNRTQTDLGTSDGGGGFYSYSATGFGAGAAINVTRQVALDEFAVEATVTNVPLNGTLVVKKQGNGTVYYSQAVTVTERGRQFVRSGTLPTPLRLDPGSYAVMLYLNGDWQDNEIYASTERLAFGTFAGTTYETGTSPSAGYSIQYPSYAARVSLSTVDPPVITSTATLPTGVINRAYAVFNHTAAGGWGAYTWSLAAGALPAGMTLSAGGTLSGTPTQAGIFRPLVKVTDGAGLFSTQLETLIVNPALSVATTNLPDYSSSGPLTFSVPLLARGGMPAYSWGCTGLPAGFSCNASGVLSGALGQSCPSPTVNFTATVTDANASSANKSLSFRCFGTTTPAILTTKLADGWVGIDYGIQALEGRGGSTNFWQVVSGSLPPGLSLNSTGFIMGTPTTANTYNFTLRYSGIAASDKPFSITVSAPVLPDYWVRRGLTGGQMGNLVFSPNYAQDGTVIGMAGRLLYISRSRGYFWKPMNLRLHATTVGSRVYPDRFTSVAFAPDFDGRPLSDPNRPGGASYTLLATADHSGAWYSDDLDATWYPLTSGLASADGGAFTNAADAFFDPAWSSSHVVYARGWNSLLQGNSLLSVTINTGSRTGTWAPVSFNQPDFAGFVKPAPEFAATGVLFGADGTGRLYRSTDRGLNWLPLFSFAGSGGLGRLAISPKYSLDSRLLAVTGAPGGGGYPMISTDGGASFVRRGLNDTVNDLRFPPNYDAASNAVFYALGGASGYGATQVLTSTDDGDSFLPTGTAGTSTTGIDAAQPLIVSPDFANDGALFISGNNTVDIAFYRSNSRGANWGPSDNGVYLQEIKTVQFAAGWASSGRAYLGTAKNVYATKNFGKAWSRGNLSGQYTASLRVSPSNDLALFTFSCYDRDNCDIYASSDGGQTFNCQYCNQLNLDIDSPDSFQISPNISSDYTMFYVQSTWDPSDDSSRKLFMSHDGGVSFTEENVDATGGDVAYFRPRFALSPSFGSDQTAFFNVTNLSWADGLVTNDGLAPNPIGFFSSVAAMGNQAPAMPPSFNFNTGTNGTASHTLFWNCQKSTDAGNTFANVPTSGPGCSRNGLLVVSPGYATDNTVFSWVGEPDGANPQLGLFKSTNGGASFTRLTVAGDPGAFDVVNQVALAPNYLNGVANRQTILVGTGAGLYRSDDGGSNWTVVSGTESFATDVSAAASDPNVRGRIFIGTQTSGVYRSDDDGVTAASITGNLGTTPVVAMLALNGGAGTTVLLAVNASGVWRSTIAANGTWSGSWSNTRPGTFLTLTQATIASVLTVYAAPGNSGTSYLSTNLGLGWSAMGAGGANAANFDYNSQSTPTFSEPAVKGIAPRYTTGNQAALWGAVVASGASYSNDNGANWSSAPGSNDYTLPLVSGYTAVKALGVNALSAAREVLIGHSSQGVFLSRDGGVTWRNVSGPGSGLELTSKNASTFLSATTPTGGTDVLVGINGNLNGGVYLSGDGGEHWTQVNQGYDPNNLSISSLVKSSCGGCPVQYYSGTYGSGVYTRTITVNPPPAFPSANASCWGSTVCACASPAGSGPEQGGQAFKLCGSGFLNGATVEFDGVPATGCTQSGGTVITCTGTPPHAAGAATVKVRNPDTRSGSLPTAYTYTNGAPRTGNTLRVVKNSADGWVSWTCASCTGGAPARLYRSQSADFSLFFEQYNGGANGTQTGGCTGAAGNNSCYNQTGTVGNPQSYFWNVE